MRRITTGSIAALLAALATASAAHGASQVRSFSGEVGGGFGPEGRISLEIVFKNERAKGKFTPRHVTEVALEQLPVRCAGPPGEQTLLTTAIATRIKLSKLPPPATAKPKANRYAFRFSHVFSEFTGDIAGKVDKRNGRAKPRSNGDLTIIDFDFPPPGPQNCETSGPRGWSAFQVSV